MTDLAIIAQEGDTPKPTKRCRISENVLQMMVEAGCSHGKEVHSITRSADGSITVQFKAPSVGGEAIGVDAEWEKYYEQNG